MLLDLALESRIEIPAGHDTTWWIERVSAGAAEIQEKVFTRLIGHRMLEREETGLVFLTSRVRRSRRYTTADGHRRTGA